MNAVSRCVAIALSALSVALLASCPSSTDPGTGSSDYFVSVLVFPVSPGHLSGTVEYEAAASIMNMRAAGFGDATGAIIRVNGVALTQSSGLKYAFNSNPPVIGNFKQGDSIAISVEYEAVGKIERTLTVPASATSFAFSPEFPSTGTPNYRSAYTMSWAGVSGANIDYLPSVDVFSGNASSNRVKSISFQTSNNSYGIGAQYLTSGGVPYPYLAFRLKTCAKESLPDCYYDSAFRIAGVCIAVKSNLSPE
jgi:hypothetical protein